MKRRGALFGGVAVVAAAGGLIAARWTGRAPHHVDPAASAHSPTPGASAVAARDAGVPDLQAMRFDRPDGSVLKLADFAGRPLLLNFWAPWCPPCVTELPLLDRFHREQPAQGWRVVGVAVDNRAAVLAFLQNHPVHFPIGLAGFDGVALTRRLGNPSGGLPFSVLLDRAGAIVERKLGAIHSDYLQALTARGS